jgi:hypothetical protein
MKNNDIKEITDMKVLELTLNKKWFDLIEKGIKTEEYRELKRYWIVRLMSNVEYLTDSQGYLTDLEGVKNIGARFKHFDLIRFSNGYSKSSRRITMELQNISIGRGLPEWGAVEGQEYFVIKIGREVSRQNC